MQLQRTPDNQVTPLGKIDWAAFPPDTDILLKGKINWANSEQLTTNATVTILMPTTLAGCRINARTIKVISCLDSLLTGFHPTTENLEFHHCIRLAKFQEEMNICSNLTITHCIVSGFESIVFGPMKNVDLSRNKRIGSLVGINKMFPEINGHLDLSANTITKGIAYLLMIRGLKSVVLSNSQVTDTINHYLANGYVGPQYIKRLTDDLWLIDPKYGVLE